MLCTTGGVHGLKKESDSPDSNSLFGSFNVKLFHT